MKLSEGLERLAKEALTMDRDQLAMRILGASVQAAELEEQEQTVREELRLGDGKVVSGG